MSTQSEPELLGKPWWQRPLEFIVYLLGLLSVVVGGRNAATHSQDFQWSGTRMLLDKIDPWLDYLQGDPLHRILLVQVPNYLPEFYLLLAPVGLLPFSRAKFAWFLCNVAFIVLSTVLACRFFDLRGSKMALTLAFYVMSTPVRNSLGNGQQSLLVIFLWCLALLSTELTDGRATIAGLSYGKFNFAPPVVLYLFFKKGIRAVLFSAILPAVGTAIIWLWLTGGRDVHAIARLIMQPLAVSRIGYLPRGGDMNLMDVLDIPLMKLGVSPLHADTIETALAILACALIFYVGIRKHANTATQFHLSLLGTAGFVLFRHHAYDAVSLLFPLCFALRLWHDRRAKIMLGLLAYIFYGQRVLEAAKIFHGYLSIPSFFILLGVLYLTYQLRDVNVWPTTTRDASPNATA